MEKPIEKLLEESIEADDAFISIEKKGNKAKINAIGKNASLLIALVSLEKHILNKLNISEETYLMLKPVIETKIGGC